MPAVNESPSSGTIDYVAVQSSEEFGELRRKHRSFVFPLAVVFLVWYAAYVILAAYFPAFMAQRVWGDITIGLLLGLGQFVTTFVITAAYVSYANKKLDPRSVEIRAELERVGGVK